MPDALSPYPAYKDSGVPWLGSIPAHWESRPLKRWVRVNAEVLPEDTPDDFEFRYLDIGSIGTGILASKPQRLRFGGAPSRARRVLRRGDTIVSTVRTYLKAVYFVSEDVSDLIASTGFAVLTPGEHVDPRFLSFLVQSDPFTDRVSADSVGTAYPAIAETRLGTFHAAIPPLPEQRAITRYLDHVDRCIRRYIRARQKLIALLEEQKQAVIHQAVTGQIDVRTGRRYPAYKPSGVAWLGDVPEHWEILRSKYLFQEIDARSVSGEEVRLSMSQRFGLIPSSELEEKRLLSESSVGGKLCEKGDLVLNRLKAHLGVFALARQPGIVSPDYTVFRPSREIVSQYFEAVYRTPACRVELRQKAKGIVQGFWRLYTDDFYDIQMPVPPVSEQRAIMERLGTELSDLACAIDRTQREIALLREYRTRLLADVVTGQVDVRAAAARLPAEGEEIDALNEVEELAEDEEGEEQMDEEEETDG
jgi:type I restriction enzyme S subunit